MRKRRSTAEVWAVRTVKIGSILLLVRGGLLGVALIAGLSSGGSQIGAMYFFIYWPDTMCCPGMIISPPGASASNGLDVFVAYVFLAVSSYNWGFVLATLAAIIDTVLPDPQHKKKRRR